MNKQSISFFSVLLAFVFAIPINAQNLNQKTDKEFGLKVLASWGFPSAFTNSLDGVNAIRSINGGGGAGFSAGVYWTLALETTKRLSIQPELLFHNMNLDEFSTTKFGDGQYGQVRPLYHYGLTLPILLKYALTDKLSIYAGPSLHYFMEVVDKTANKNFGAPIYNNGDRNALNLSITPGIEYAISKTIKAEARYHYAFANMFKDDNNVGRAYNFNPQYVELGVAIKLCSGKPSASMPKDAPEEPKKAVTPIDTDKDGIADADDKCPTVAGVASNNGCPAIAPATTPVTIIDTDKDGIADADDKCPTVAGVAENGGCPAVIDTDKDGIADANDKCPTVAGVTENGGCPAVIDTDKDGIADANDKCPTVAGVAENGGCPAIIDTDKDGIADANDKCPTVAGVAENGGCPAIDEAVKTTLAQALKGVQFESGKSILKPSSTTILNNVVDIMKKYPSYKLAISGHTDGVGNPAKNLQLSKDRASAVKAFLVSKGVDGNKLFPEGYGSNKPIADNATKAGQETNRRVELSIVQ